MKLESTQTPTKDDIKKHADELVAFTNTLIQENTFIMDLVTRYKDDPNHNTVLLEMIRHIIMSKHKRITFMMALIDDMREYINAL